METAQDFADRRTNEQQIARLMCAAPTTRGIGFRISVPTGQSADAQDHLYSVLGDDTFVVTDDGTRVWFWAMASGPIPNLCNHGISASIEAVWETR